MSQAIYSSGISTSEAESLGTFATTNNGELIEWFGYPGHFQQQVWNASYREQWITNVTEEIADGPFDGIMADNDVFDDYYNHNISPEALREALDQFIDELGPALAQFNKILAPNIAEARREKVAGPATANTVVALKNAGSDGVLNPTNACG